MGRALDSFMRGFGRSFSPGITEGANLGRAMLAKRAQQKRIDRLLGEKIAREEAKEKTRVSEWETERTDRTAAAGTKAGALLAAQKTSASFNPNVTPEALGSAYGIKRGSPRYTASVAVQAAAQAKAAAKRSDERSLVRLRASESAGHKETAATTAHGRAKELAKLTIGLRNANKRSGVDRAGHADLEANREMMKMIADAAKEALMEGGPRKVSAMKTLSAVRSISKIRKIAKAKIPRSLFNIIDKHGHSVFVGVGDEEVGGSPINWLGLDRVPASRIDERM